MVVRLCHGVIMNLVARHGELLFAERVYIRGIHSDAYSG